MDIQEIQFLLNDLWLLVAAALVFLMQCGFLALEAGITRKKNSVNVAAKNLIDLAVSITLFWLFGFGIMFGLSNDGLIGTNLFSPNFLQIAQAIDLSNLTYNPASFFLFQAMFCGTAVTIISGASAERMRFESYLIVSLIVSGLVYPIFGHWAWGGLFTGQTAGWLAVNGFVDFAGSTVVHSIGGWAALAVIIVLGPRLGRFDAEGQPRKLPHADLPVAAIGTLILWFGWFGFNGGSALLSGGNVGLIIVNTMLAGASGVILMVPVGIYLNRGVVEVNYLMNGALAGLVAITASAHAVTPNNAMVIGLVGAIMMLLLDGALLRLRFDDAVGAISVHLGAGIWGTIAVAIYGDPAILGTGLNNFQQLGIQVMGICAAGAWTFATMLILLVLINRFFVLRVSQEEEIAGLNVSEQGILPDYSEFPGLKRLLEEAPARSNKSEVNRSTPSRVVRQRR
ncbi:MAG: ammonium transporter [Chloroflexota bacterium]